MDMDFEKLYNTYYMQVYSYLITLTKCQDTAEEITQNAFFKAMTTEKKYRGSSGEFTWLCAIAKNLFLDDVKKKKRRSHVELEESHTEESDKSGIEHALADEDSAFRIHQVLHALEEPYKEIFQLRVFGELSFQKIGLLFEKSENWARVTYHRARLKIQEKMEETL